jgi:SAM-dependent MidA family methyltransferase
MPDLLPPPADDARAVSAALVERIRKAIESRQGCLPFEDYMAMALYEPGLGYYSNGLLPFGEQGDFITAPESGELFGRCLARSLASVLQQLGGGELLELGAGSGALACTVLLELKRLGTLPERYRILERSGAMRHLQQRSLQPWIEQGICVEWLDTLPQQPVDGVLFGNEVADALPVGRFSWRAGELVTLGVSWRQQQLGYCEMPADEGLAARVRRLAEAGAWRGRYDSEYCPSLPAWIGALARCLRLGALLLVDYGYGRGEYYHPQRSMGTLLCHYRHQAHDDALWYPGLQDITAFVDFTAIAEAASDAGMRLQGYASQAHFLMHCGIDQLLSEIDPDATRRYLALSNEAKRLLLPGEMGERFKCMVFSRGLPADVLGCSPRDLRGRL